MGEKLLGKISRLYIAFALIAIIISAVFAVYCNRIEIALVTVGIAALYFVATIILKRYQRKWINKYLEGVEDEIESNLRDSIKFHPLPVCVVNSEERLAIVNDKFRKIFPNIQILNTKIKDLIGYDQSELIPDAKEKLLINVGDRTYNILPSARASETSKSVMLYFVDVTEHENLKIKYQNEKSCFAKVIVDNYDELLSKSSEDRKPIVSANIETAIRTWAAGLEALVLKLKKDQYQLIFDRKYFKGLVDSKFTILDEVRKIETDAEFPASISIGVGIDGVSPAQTEEYAVTSLDLAQGRGGDQAVIKSGRKVEYYGGKAQFFEIRNKGKSRVMAHALKRLISHSSQVIVMGHINPDMDSFGAAVGIHRIAFANNRRTYIVLNNDTQFIDDVYKEALKAGTYNFVDNKEALALAENPDTLLVIVDTNVPDLVECRELLNKVDKKVLIDHHRKKENSIDNTTLTFLEPNASSASELITELMQYDDDLRKINKSEADLLLAGIIVDTNSFSYRTGSRTFEAASWLRNNGGDSSSVRRLLQTGVVDFKLRAEIIANATIDNSGIAISQIAGKHDNMQLIIAQAADELLGVKGMLASFVVASNKDDVLISARSLGDLNVQVIMERFNGGGHLTAAAAQVRSKKVEEVVRTLKKYIKEALV